MDEGMNRWMDGWIGQFREISLLAIMVAKKYFNIERFYIYLFIYLWCAPETTRNSDEDKTPI